jgi:hypothetical protein
LGSIANGEYGHDDCTLDTDYNKDDVNHKRQEHDTSDQTRQEVFGLLGRLDPVSIFAMVGEGEVLSELLSALGTHFLPHHANPPRGKPVVLIMKAVTSR